MDLRKGLPAGRPSRVRPKPFQRASIDLDKAERRWGQVRAGDLVPGDIVPGLGALESVTGAYFDGDGAVVVIKGPSGEQALGQHTEIRAFSSAAR